MELQPIEAKKSEIEFRKKLVQIHVEGKKVLENEFDAEGIIRILAARMKNTAADMEALQREGIPLSPYIEIGAERGQRALVMENDLGMTGAAVDLSFDMLKSCDHFARVFQRTKFPLRICTDANTLPFRSGSVPFIFCYETLHHFPSPVPIVKEIARVLAPGGYFFFDEEPFRKILHVNLYKKEKEYSEQSLHEGFLRKVMDYFFGEPNCNEVDHGVIENNDIPMSDWEKSFKFFEEKKVNLSSMQVIKTAMYPRKNYLLYPLAFLLGGRISALCRKGGSSHRKISSIREVLICPECRATGVESDLRQDSSSMCCSRCNTRYPGYEGVQFLLEKEKFNEFYPDICRKIPDMVV